MGSLSRMALVRNINLISSASSRHNNIRLKCTSATLKTTQLLELFPNISHIGCKSIPRAPVRKTTIGLSSSGATQEYAIKSNYFDLNTQQRNQTLQKVSWVKPLLLQQLNLHQLQLRKYSNQSNQNVPHKDMKHNNMKDQKTYIRQVTKNLTLYTKKPFTSEIDPKTLEMKQPTGNPLVLVMAWLMARQKHLKKYAYLYNEMGFDVVVVSVTPWQLLWPTKGTQIVAADTLKFLENNSAYSQIIMHGFSVGAYQFGEMMLMMSRDIERYQPILDRFVSQVWDSAADITEIPVGLPKSIFPKNASMQNALRSYTLYHMKTFYNQATVHYARSSQMFHFTLLKAPAIFFVSENDPIGPPSSNQSVREDWERANIPVTFKCWERSIHAAHFMKHRDEYLEFLYKHLESSGVFETVAEKSRAKL